MTIFTRTRSNRYFAFWCQGCKDLHLIPDYEGSKVRWQFNGDYEKPTLSPSIKHDWGKVDKPHCCHYFIKDGQIQFCGDCHHDLKGQTLPLEHIPLDELEYLAHEKTDDSSQG